MRPRRQAGGWPIPALAVSPSEGRALTAQVQGIRPACPAVAQPASMPDTTRLTQIQPRVRDPETLEQFYADRLGLKVRGDEGRGTVLAPGAGAFRLLLQADPNASRRPRGSLGLYHWALRVPDRSSLAAVLAHLAEKDVEIQGLVDHGVSEALYVSDPEGNGVEVYWDKPREEWPTRGDEVAMVTESLDPRGLLDDAEEASPLPGDTELGHVHLSVASLQDAGSFYQRLGLRVRQSTYPGALFLAAGDYHHHVGLNTWGSGQSAPPGSAGLIGFTFGIPESDWEDWRSSIELVPVEEGKRGLVFEDPNGIRIDARKM